MYIGCELGPREADGPPWTSQAWWLSGSSLDTWLNSLTFFPSLVLASAFAALFGGATFTAKTQWEYCESHLYILSVWSVIYMIAGSLP